MAHTHPHHLLTILLLACSLALLAGCGAASKLASIRPRPQVLVQRAADRVAEQLPTSNVLGSRTAADPLTVVEAYLQKYQPGSLPRVFQTTYLYDRSGVLMAELYPEGRRTWVSLARISQTLIDATIATEDASFYSNAGVDPRRLAGAVLQNAEAQGVVSGASTITMQLARNLFMEAEQRFDATLNRKLLEIGLAQELTGLYSKDELLEMYLNLLNYGNLAYGPEAAAQVYFGKSAADLNLAEATLLAGIPQRPAGLNPFTNLDEVKERQRVVLSLMVRHGYLTERQADLVFEQPLQLRADAGLTPVNRAPHFTQYVLDTLGVQLGEDYTARAGLRIITSLDLPMQALAERIVKEEVAKLRGLNISNGSLVALKPGTAEVLVMVGSVDFFNNAVAGQVNVAARLRQPGSTVKPLLYAAALDANLISPATVLWDTPMRYEIKGQPPYQPRNYDNKFHGPVTVRAALANSYNVPAVKLLDAFGVDNMLTIVRNMGLQSLRDERNWYGLSLTLGGGEVTLTDLTTSFHTLANEGRYLPPQPVLAIVDGYGQSETPAASIEAVSVVSPRAAFLVTDILSDGQARAPMFGTNSWLNLSRPAAAKTGTTTDWRDNWTVGYTRYLVTGVWTGNADGRPTRQSTGARGAAPIWHNFMEAVIADPAMLAVLDAPAAEEGWHFVMPDGIEQRAECPPGMACRAGGEYFTQDWLAASGSNGPIGDTAASVVAAPVYLDRGGQSRRIGYCSVQNPPPGVARTTLLKLPAELGLPSRLPGSGLTSSGEVDTEAEPEAESDAEIAAQERAARVERERALAMTWNLNTSIPVLLGACDTLDSAVRAYLPADIRNSARLLVDFAAVGRPAVVSRPGAAVEETPPTDTATAQTEPTPAANAPVANAPAPVSTQYVTQAVEHGNDCPGNYIMGRILNTAGAPVPGIRILVVDEWGNRAEAVSKGSPGEAGLFDIPLYNDSPRDLYVNVLDGAGNPISPATLVPHRKGPAVDTGCHLVVFRAVS